MNKPNILFMMPNWQAPSELFIERMIEFLEPHICNIATRNAPERKWNNNIPILNISNSPSSYIEKIASKFGLIGQNYFSKKNNIELKKLATKKDVEIIFINFLNFAVKYENLWNSIQKPIYIHCHGQDVTWDHRSHEEPNKLTHSPDYLLSIKNLSKKAIFIANSKVTYSNLINGGIASERIILKYIGVPVEKNLTNRLIDKKSKIEILYLGRLIDCKGPDLVIRAFELACNKGLNASLVIAGEGPLKITCELLRLQSIHKNRINLIGSITPDQGKILRQKADIFCAHNCYGLLSHQEEALGVSILEAMADGLPVITGNSGGVKETIVDGITGILVEPGNIDQQAQAFLKLANDHILRYQMGLSAWSHVKNNFSIENEKAQLMKIFGY